MASFNCAKVKAIRTEKGLTQHQLGVLAGLNQRAVSRIECCDSNKINPTVKTILRVATALGVEASVFFD